MTRVISYSYFIDSFGKLIKKPIIKSEGGLYIKNINIENRREIRKKLYFKKIYEINKTKIKGIKID